MIVADLDTQQMPNDTWETLGRVVLEHDDALYDRHAALVVFIGRDKTAKPKAGAGAHGLQVVTRELVQKPAGWDLYGGYIWDGTAALSVAAAFTQAAAPAGVASLDALTVGDARWTETAKRYVKDGPRWFVVHHYDVASEKRVQIRHVKKRSGGWQTISYLDLPAAAAAAWARELMKLAQTIAKLRAR